MSDGMYLKSNQSGGLYFGATELKFTVADKNNIEKNTKARHTHNNREIIDKITEEQLKAIENVKNKEDSANKTTELSESSTEEQYPSAKAVVGYIDTAIQTAILDSWEAEV